MEQEMLFEVWKAAGYTIIDRRKKKQKSSSEKTL